LNGAPLRKKGGGASPRSRPSRTGVVRETNTTNGFVVVWGTAVIWGTDQPFPGMVAVRGRSLMWIVG